MRGSRSESGKSGLLEAHENMEGLEEEEEEDMLLEEDTSLRPLQLESRPSQMLNSVVDQDGEHSVLAPESYDQLSELNYSTSGSNYQEFAERYVNLDGSTSSAAPICSECGASSILVGPSFEPERAQKKPQVRGWPEEFSQISEALFQARQEARLNEEDEDEDEEGLITLWPLVELHENPLNSVELQHQQQLVPPSVDYESEAELALGRSRLLSLREGQRQNRAAIRMVSRSSDTIDSCKVVQRYVSVESERSGEALKRQLCSRVSRLMAGLTVRLRDRQ